MANLDQFFSEVKDAVDRRLDEVLPAADMTPATLHEAIRWNVFAGGKRLRPALVIAVGETFGAERTNLLSTAAAVEMIHSYSLIHDDLPSMDNDDLRRGRATCHIKYGEATAILAGDALQALAFNAVAGDDALSAEARIDLVKLLTAAASTPNGMVAGQQLDLEGEGEALSIEAVTEIHRGKTGAMITASAVAGAIIAGSDAAVREAVERYGASLGLLFQIADDLLDETQETEVLGKTAGKDAAARKSTFPSFYGLERTREIAREVCVEARLSIRLAGGNTDLLERIAQFVLERES